MNNPFEIECPYCGGLINHHVDVCRHCHRDVRKYLDLKLKYDECLKELNEYKLRYAPIESTIAETPEIKKKKHKPIHYGLFLFTYLILSTLLIAYTTSVTQFAFVGFYFYQYVFFMAMPIVIFFGTRYVGDFNIWIITLITISQAMLLETLCLRLQILPGMEVLESFSSSFYIFPVYTLIVGYLFAVFSHESGFKQMFGSAWFKDYFTSNKSNYEKFDKILMLVSTMATIISILIFIIAT